MRLLIAGGGTGGHLFPGVAVAEELMARDAGHSVHFAGTDRGLEARVLPALGFPLTTVRGAGFVGAGIRGALRSLALLAGGMADAARLLRGYRPHACLGVGGYVSFPVVGTARLRGIPTAVQEQNAWPGLANRVLGRIVQRVYAGVPDAVCRFPRHKTRVTGNPLRKDLAQPLPYQPPDAAETPRLLILGGSQGARPLNEVLPLTLARLRRPVEVLHQTGRGKLAEVAAAYGDVRGVRVVEFVEDVRQAYGWAHLVVARAGALTVAELAAAARPAILIPYPFAAGRHQDANALAAERCGAALCQREVELDADALGGAIARLLAEPERLRTMAACAATSARRDAAREIVDDLLALATGPGH